MRPLLKILEASQGALKTIQNSSNVPIASIGLKKSQPTSKENANPMALLDRLTTTKPTPVAAVAPESVDYNKITDII